MFEKQDMLTYSYHVSYVPSILPKFLILISLMSYNVAHIDDELYVDFFTS